MHGRSTLTAVRRRSYYYEPAFSFIFLLIILLFLFRKLCDDNRHRFLSVSNNTIKTRYKSRRPPSLSHVATMRKTQSVRFIFWRCAIRILYYTINAFVRNFISLRRRAVILLILFGCVRAHYGNDINLLYL